jgi:copper resistance protein B
MGHCKPAADPHAGHNMGAGQSGAALPPASPPPAAAFSGPEHAQDLFYPNADAARSRRDLIREHGGLTASRIFVDQAEVAIREGREGYSFDAQAWYGGDINKLWIKTEGEGTFGERFEGAEVQALWSRAIDPWFDMQLGVRQDFQSGPDRTYLVAGIQGLAPYWFEVEGTAFLSSKGDVTARFEAEYDLRLTRALILQPLVEVDLALQDVPELGIGSGLSTAELGARLRYQILPSSGPAEISPYIGVQYERTFGDTARFRRLSDEDVGGWSLLIGLRTWF